MLKVLRRNTKLVIWIVVISFALWGGFAVSQQFSDVGMNKAGKLFGKSVSYQEFNSFYRANQIFSISKEPITDPEVLKMQTWQSIILSREAKNQGVKVSDDEVRSEILRMLKDLKIDNPTADFYKRWVEANFRQKAAEFENQVREILRIQKLVRALNDQPVDIPTDEEIRTRFVRERNNLSVEFARFATQEEADVFFKDHQTLEAWNQAKEADAEKFRSTGKVAIDAVINLWGFPEEAVIAMLGQDIDSILAPVQRLSQDFAVLRIEDKQLADETTFDDEMKQKYRDRIIELKKRQRFFEWNRSIIERAKLEDFIPAAESIASGEASDESEPTPLAEGETASGAADVPAETQHDPEAAPQS